MNDERVKREAAESRLLDVLTSLDIQMRLWGCGCCDSPQLTFIYQEEVIVEYGHLLDSGECTGDKFLFDNIK